MKYAVVRSGGKQYIAREGETIEVDRLSLEVGKPVNFDEVLLITDGKKVQVGGPLIKGASVKGKVLDQFKSKKIVVFKYIPKERYRRKKGHRQHYTRVEIEEIVTGSSKPAAAEAAKEAASTSPTEATPTAEKAAARKPAAKKPAAKKTTPKSETAAKPKASKKPASSAKKTSSTKAKPAAKGGGSKSTTAKKSSTASKKPAEKKDK